MTTRERGLAPEPDPSTAPATTPTSSTTSVVEDGGSRGELLARAHAQRDRYGQLMETVRSVLAEQPSPTTVRNAARRIADDITRLAANLADALSDHVIDTRE